MIKPQRFTLEVTSKEEISPEIYEVHFKVVEPPEIVFNAGQTMMLMVAPGINRSMSIASSPRQKTELLMLHDVRPMGPGSKWTLALQVGDQAKIMAPLGIFTLKKEEHKRKVLVATGTGVAPFYSMIVDYYETGGTDEVILYWGLRHEENIYWLDKFDAISKQYPQFTLALTLSQPKEDWTGLKGRVTAHVVQQEQNMLQSDFYLCGSQAMVDDIKAQLAQKGVPREQIKTELYF